MLEQLEQKKMSSFYGPSNLVELIQYRAKLQPNDLAFLYLTDGVSSEIRITYSELDKKCQAVAAWLLAHNMTGKRILLLYPPGLDFIVAFYGCLYAGATAVPVYPPRRNRSMLRIQTVSDSANASLALTTSDVLNRVQSLIDETPKLKEIPWLSTSTISDEIAKDWSMPSLSEDTRAFFQYTSGSTGDPKGVMLTHGNMLHNSMLICTGFEHTRSSVGVFWLPSYHDMGLIGGVIQPVYCGRPNIIMSPLAFLQKPFRWLAAITRYRATTSGGPNFAYDLCIRSIKEEQLDELDLSSWKVAFNGAEPVQAETLEQFAAKFERCGFRYDAFYPCFGLAEATLLVTGGTRDGKPVIRTVDADALAAGNAVDAIPGTGRARRLVSSGRVIIDQRVVIVNPETCQECSPGTIGEIWTKSDSVAQGYWNNPEATKRTFQAYIAKTGEGPFMRTGDLGFMLDGELFVTGRSKDLIISHGVNIYPQDIELTAQKVSDLCRPNCGGAFTVGDPRKEKLVLVQEVERRFKLENAEEIFKKIRKEIALEHEIPVDYIVLIRAGSIPKTSSGKIQRHACRTAFLDGSLKILAQWSLEESNKIIPAEKKSTGTAAFTEEDNPLYDGATDNNLKGTVQPTTPPRDISSIFEVETRTTGVTTETTISKAKPASKPSQTVSPSDISFNETAKIVLEEVHRVGRERSRNLTLDSDITELGLDSLERMEILAGLEDRFGGQFPEHVLPTLFTAREVVEAVRKYLGSTGGTKVHREEKTYTITEECYDVAKFPEYVSLHQRIGMVKQMNLSHFFDVHEGITGATTQINGKKFINFSSYNYIGSSGHPTVQKAAQDAIAKYGTSVSASRIVSGEKPIHRELENEITKFLGTEDTIILVAGHQTNESVVGHIVNGEDLILHDALAHNSLVQGAVLSGARRRPFPHNDWDAAGKILDQHRNQYRRVLILLEGVYSMDGDYPDLPEFIQIRNKYKTLLMVDEAHSLGVLGKTGRGIGEHFQINRNDVDIWMGTMSKTLGSCGGYISGRKELIEYLKYTVPAFVFSVGMPPAQAGAALASLKLLEQEPERSEKLRENSRFFKKLASKYNMNTGMAKDTGVVPVIIGNSIQCMMISHMLFENGINAQPILHPAVEERLARIRFFLTSEHTHEQIEQTIEILAKILEEVVKK